MPDPSISSAGLRIVRLLVGNPPQTINDLVRAAGVTRTAVTEQLHELEAAGFVERKIERLSIRGRPRHLYSATRASLLLLFASNQHLVVPALWQAIDECGGPELTKQILQKVSHSLADHYARRITAKQPKDRLRKLIELLEEEGGLADVIEGNSHSVFQKRSCPFISMVDDQRTICAVDLDMMTAVVGSPVRQTGCRHDGAPCCTFEIGPEA